jgi:hypothetical protein
MPLYNPIDDFREETPPPEPIETKADIPKEWDIFWKSIEAFLPEGKTLEDLTPQELARIKQQYRFSPMRPGIYQGITGFGNMI